MYIDNEDIHKMAIEFGDAHSDFIEEIDRIAAKHGLPSKIARQIAYDVFKEVDLDDTDNS